MTDSHDFRLDCGLCVLRPWRHDDLALLVRSANNLKVAANLRDRFPHPYTEADGRAWLELATTDLSEWRWAIEFEEEAVGGIGLMPQNDINTGTAEIGYWLGEPFWGRGITTTAVKVLTRHALTALGFRRLYAWAFGPNVASQRVLEKAGYVREGLLRRSAIKHGEVLDQTLYAFVDGDL
ncbi:MAG: GNAT family protein [Planctomycetaceae bacterium]